MSFKPIANKFGTAPVIMSVTHTPVPNLVQICPREACGQSLTIKKFLGNSLTGKTCRWIFTLDG